MDESSKIPGRPRSDRARDAILAAAFALLQERGYDGLAIEAVAKRAGAGKTTVYRWWATKSELAVDAFFHATQAELAFPDTGSASGDFRAQILELAGLLRGSRGSVLAAMLTGSHTDPELATALRTRWLEPRRRWGVERMTRAVTEGECRPGVDVSAALAVLYSPLYTPLLFGREVPSPAEVEAYLRIAFAGIFVSLV